MLTIQVSFVVVDVQYLYINECNSVSFESFNELSIRTKDEVFLDYNPTAEFWVQTELEGQEDAEKIILTYKDNEALDKGIIDQIEKNIKKASKLLTTGAIGFECICETVKWDRLEGVVSSVTGRQIDTIPNEARLIGIGVDFGYTNDPTSLL